MVKEVVWTPLAVETFDNIIDYLSINFGETAVKRFVQSVDAKIKLIQSRPRMFRPTHKRVNTYITIIRKRTTLTYRYKASKNQIELVVFWGMQNPANKPN
jgi:plasmid stabilization system protein ParE